MARHLGSFVLDSSALGGLLLIGCALAALIWANSSAGGSYRDLWQITAGMEFDQWGLSKPLLLWVNDGLMAIFFLLVGLEIKREAMEGALSTPRKAALPVFAAIGGMVVPAAIFLMFTWGTPDVRGWAIPAATDIAFVLGIIGLLGSRVPVSIKVFVTAVAVVDDLGAVLIIALFYSDSLSVVSLMVAAICLVALVGLNRIQSRSSALYIAVGLILWVAVLKSGVHPTIAGVLLALTIPKEMIHRWEHGLKPWVFYGIMPVFALANAGVMLDSESMEALEPHVALGVGMGLLLGKPVGVTFMAWLATRFGLARMPDSCTWAQIHGAAWLAGIGFTMSLFIADLAYNAGDPALTSAKVGLLLASLLGGAVGTVLLFYSTTKPDAQPALQVHDPAGPQS